MYVIRTTLAALMLCLALAACNLSGEQGFSSRKNATEPAALAHKLDNVAREFPISELKHVATVPELPEAEGKVIGIITQDQRIESVDEATIQEILRPAVQRHVDAYLPAYRNFRISNPYFMLSKGGRLVLVVPIFNGNLPSQRIYVETVMVGGKHIVVPHQAMTRRCYPDSSSTSCEGTCTLVDEEQPNGVIHYWCECSIDGQNRGCSMEIKFR